MIVEYVKHYLLAGHDGPRCSHAKMLSSSGHFSILTAVIQDIVDKLRTRQHRQSTRNNYYFIWKKFNEFFIKLDVKPNSWEECLILFVGYLIDKKLKSTMIHCYVSAIKAVLRDDGEILDPNVYLLKALTRACKIQNDKVKVRLPIRKPMLLILIDEIDAVYFNQPYLIALYKVLLITMYFGLFRISEVSKSGHVLKARNVHVGKIRKR